VATDVHFAQSIRYRIDPDGDGRPLLMHEFLSGPLSAIRLPVAELDPTLEPVALYNEGGLFNFGVVRIEPGPDGLMHLLADVRDESGAVRPGSHVDLAPQ
jgi:alkaline phosphatase D